LRVYPSEETLRSLVPPLETQVFAGNQVSRVRGEGIEFADLREWQPGDRVRRVNWRATALRGSLWVNEQYPERNTDVVLFLDTFAEVRAHGRSTNDRAVRAAATLAHGYLQRKDRVGLVGFGGVLSWLVPESGTRQLYAIIDTLLSSDIVHSYALRGVEVLPPRTLPPKALVLAITPLLDDRTAAAAARPARPALRPDRGRGVTGRRCSNRIRPRLPSSPTASGASRVKRCAGATSRWACPSSPGAKANRSPPRSRR